VLAGRGLAVQFCVGERSGMSAAVAGKIGHSLSQKLR
jgi:hypothetical protein